MGLSGNLQDFDISYIFQIISQEKKTGNLILSFEENEAYVIFKNGTIISAGNTIENLQTFLFRYLHIVKKYSQTEIAELRAMYHNNLRHLANELVEKNYISSHELSTITETGIFDLACSIFFWHNGTFRFDSIPNVDIFQIGSFSASADAITMDAARRLDEWSRMSRFVNPETVFIRTDLTGSIDLRMLTDDPLDSFGKYLLALIDGASTCDYLCEQSFFSKYHVYETLYELLQSKQIFPLSDKISHSVNEALQRSSDYSDSVSSKIVLSSIVTAVILLVLYFSSNILIRGIILSQQTKLSKQSVRELAYEHSQEKISIALITIQNAFWQYSKNI